MRTESDLEKLLAFHPYLINEEFAGLHPIRQLTCGKHRLDLAFYLPHGLCIVELKKTPLAVDDVRQLLRYCRAWSRRPLAKYHYLIGRRPHDESGLRKAIENSQFEIKILYINEHIPTLSVRINVCLRQRGYCWRKDTQGHRGSEAMNDNQPPNRTNCVL